MNDQPLPSAGADSLYEKARERREATLRWLRALGFAVLLLVIAGSVRTSPHPGLHGPGLAILLLLLCFALVTALAIVALSVPRLMEMLLLAIAVLCSTGLIRLQPSGFGALGLFVAVILAAMRIHGRAGGGIALLALLALAASGPFASRPVALPSNEIGVIAWYVVGVLGYRLYQGQEQAERLLAELETSREAQARTAALAERARLAREMHDVLAHSLSGLALQLAGARLLVSQGGSDAQIAGALERAHQLARAGLEEARRAIGVLREDALPGPERLAELARDFERDTGVPCAITVAGEERELGSEARLTIYRVAQEALTNVRRHTTAERVELHLGYDEDGTCLHVEDFRQRGVGKEGSENVHNRPGGSGGGYGLTGMRERAELLGGTLVAAPTASGFRVELWVPA